jgi:hypothetical protein
LDIGFHSTVKRGVWFEAEAVKEIWIWLDFPPLEMAVIPPLTPEQTIHQNLLRWRARALIQCSLHDLRVQFWPGHDFQMISITLSGFGNSLGGGIYHGTPARFPSR